MNQKEAELVVKIIEYIAQNPNIEINEKTIGIISPFRLQCRAISNIIPQKFEKDITLDTVERFQGSEREIIIISLACNYNYLIESISNETQIDGKIIDRKFNVALTRAKEHIIIMGNQDILQNSTTYYNVIEWIKQNGTYINFEEIMV
jgi:superfamily I DNA and/or RNA helicase